VWLFWIQRTSSNSSFQTLRRLPDDGTQEMPKHVVVVFFFMDDSPPSEFYVPKRRHVQFRRRGITQGKEYKCFSTAGPRFGTGPWRQLYRAARSSGICHFSFLTNFHEQMFYIGNIVRRIIFVNVSKNSDPDVGLRKLQYATRFH